VENRYVVFLEVILAFLIVWAGAAHWLELTDVISSPALVGSSLYELLISMEWVPHMAETLRRIALGFTLSLLAGTVLGVLMGVSTFWERVFQDYITIGLSFPSLFVVVFAAMWFGVSDLTPIVTAALTPMFFVAQSVYQGVNDVDTNLLRMAESFDVPRRRVLWRVVFRSVLPEWFAGARYGFAGAWKLVTLAEFFAATSGVGFMIREQMNFLSITGVLTWTALFAAVMMLIEYGGFQYVEHRVFDWRQETTIGW